jgi:hypothetical protein
VDWQKFVQPGHLYHGRALFCKPGQREGLPHVSSMHKDLHQRADTFTVTVSTKGSAILPPPIPRRFLPQTGIRVLLLLALALFLASTAKNGWVLGAAFFGRRLSLGGTLAATLLCSLIYAAGCGSTSSSVITTPPQVVTPSGTSTITITMGAMSPTQQPLQLQPVQLTLTVK